MLHMYPDGIRNQCCKSCKAIAQQTSKGKRTRKSASLLAAAMEQTRRPCKQLLGSAGTANAIPLSTALHAQRCRHSTAGIALLHCTANRCATQDLTPFTSSFSRHCRASSSGHALNQCVRSSHGSAEGTMRALQTLPGFSAQASSSVHALHQGRCMNE